MVQTFSLRDTHPEIKLLQRALNEILGLNLSTDGNLGKVTQEALQQYQQKEKIAETNRLGVCYGPTTQEKIKPYIEHRFITENDFVKAAEVLGTEVAVVKTVTMVEAKEYGFLNTGFPTLLFERHIFYKEINKKYGPKAADTVASKRPDICNVKSGGYKGGLYEVQRLEDAMKFYEEEAIKSASYGLYQLMGFNHKVCGYVDVFSFFEMMKDSERAQLMAFCNFIKSNPLLHKALVTKDWEKVARLYNGPAYKSHAIPYDVRLANTYTSLTKKP